MEDPPYYPDKGHLRGEDPGEYPILPGTRHPRGRRERRTDGVASRRSPPFRNPWAGAARIVSTLEQYHHIFDMVPSHSNAMLFCQGCVAEMDEDVCGAIRDIGGRGKIVYVHFRNIRGGSRSFQEVFVDEGDQDMYEAMQTYKEVGFEGPFMMDHYARFSRIRIPRSGRGTRICGGVYACADPGGISLIVSGVLTGIPGLTGGEYGGAPEKQQRAEESVNEENRSRVAMIGAGGRATSAHYPSLKALKGVEMVAVSELSEQTDGRCGGTFWHSRRSIRITGQMIEKEKPDAV